MKLIIDIDEKWKEKCLWFSSIDVLNYLYDIMENGILIPDNATNERMIGKWIKSRDSYGTNHFTCPFCEHDIATRNADNWDDNYCSNCGARMEGVEYEKGYTL